MSAEIDYLPPLEGAPLPAAPNLLPHHQEVQDLREQLAKLRKDLGNELCQAKDDLEKVKKSVESLGGNVGRLNQNTWNFLNQQNSLLHNTRDSHWNWIQSMRADLNTLGKLVVGILLVGGVALVVLLLAVAEILSAGKR